MTTNSINEARAHLIDCGADVSTVKASSPQTIITEINKQYDGGWTQFIKDGE